MSSKSSRVGGFSCPHCSLHGFKGPRGLNIHIGKTHSGKTIPATAASTHGTLPPREYSPSHVATVRLVTDDTGSKQTTSRSSTGSGCHHACPYCHLSFKSDIALNSHIKRVHPEMNDCDPGECHDYQGYTPTILPTSPKVEPYMYAHNIQTESDETGTGRAAYPWVHAWLTHATSQTAHVGDCDLQFRIDSPGVESRRITTSHCPVGRQELSTPSRSTSSTAGGQRTYQPRRTTQGESVCPLCQHSFADDTGLVTHLTRTHAKVLGTVEHQLKTTGLKQAEVSGQADILNRVIEDLLKYIGNGWHRENVGSYYDKTKIHNPDEFDIMFCQRRFRCRPHVVHGHFCKLEVLTPGHVDPSLLTDGKWLCPKAFMAHFKQLVTEAKYNTETHGTRYSMRNVTIRQDPTPTSPAVEISIERTTYNDGSRPAKKEKPTVDLVPAVEIEGWPIDDDDGFKWLKEGAWESVTDRFHAVAKIHHSEYSKPPQQCTLWRLSFSTAEKELLLHADGTCTKGKTKTCRKTVLRLLKSNLQKLVSTLPAKKLETFSSFHLKALVLGMFSRRKKHRYWKEEYRGVRYIQALIMWKKAVEECFLEHHFIPGDNLLEDMECCGQKERQLLLRHIQSIFDSLKRA